jgi:hypothetical protein
VKELEEAGLVKLTTRYNSQGSQESNRIQVGMPAEELQRIARENPNRQTIRTWEKEGVKEDYTERKQTDSSFSGLSVTIENDVTKQTPPGNASPTNQKPKPSLRALLQTARRQPPDPEAARSLYQQFRASSAQQCHPEQMQIRPQSPRKAERDSPCKSALPIKNNKQILVEQRTPASALSFALPHESLHSHSRRRIDKTLAQLGFRAGQLQRISEEIAFAVTHPLPDSLFARLGVVHSINICLKKAREGQWTTPSHFPSDSIAKNR